jgi:hypothetical protein
VIPLGAALVEEVLALVEVEVVIATVVVPEVELEPDLKI